MRKIYKIFIPIFFITVIFSSCQKSNPITINNTEGFYERDRFYEKYAHYCIPEDGWVDAVYEHEGMKDDAQLYYDDDEILFIKYGKSFLFDAFVLGNQESETLDYFSDFVNRKVSIVFREDEEKEVVLDDKQKNELYDFMLELSQVDKPGETWEKVGKPNDWLAYIRVYITDEIYVEPIEILIDANGNYFIHFDALTELNEEWISFINSNTEVKIPVSVKVPEVTLKWNLFKTGDDFYS